MYIYLLKVEIQKLTKKRANEYRITRKGTIIRKTTHADAD